MIDMISLGDMLKILKSEGPIGCICKVEIESDLNIIKVTWDYKNSLGIFTRYGALFDLSLIQMTYDPSNYVSRELDRCRKAMQ